MVETLAGLEAGAGQLQGALQQETARADSAQALMEQANTVGGGGVTAAASESIGLWWVGDCVCCVYACVTASCVTVTVIMTVLAMGSLLCCYSHQHPCYCQQHIRHACYCLFQEHEAQLSAHTRSLGQQAAEMAALHAQLGRMEVGEAELQEEARSLRQALRQRDMIMLGILQEQPGAAGGQQGGGEGGGS